jgi:segregation and condensation protein B
MAFNLQKVLKALLLSSNQPLSIKDIQTVFSRYHDQAALPLLPAEGGNEETSSPSSEDAAPVVEGGALSPTPVADEATEVTAGLAEAPAPADDEIYGDVPSLVTATQIREAMQAIAEDFRTRDDALLLIEGATGFRLVTHPRFGRWIRILRDEPPPVKLTQSAIETLAIVAYRQPVTRTEIETVRGVSAEAGINKLLERELVYIVGRADVPGRPLQYGTTDKFLEFVGVKSLVELPSSDVLSPRQIDEWLKTAINPKPVTDAEMGLPLEEGEGDSPNFEPVSVDPASAPADAPAEFPPPAAEADPGADATPTSA